MIKKLSKQTIPEDIKKIIYLGLLCLGLYIIVPLNFYNVYAIYLKIFVISYIVSLVIYILFSSKLNHVSESKCDKLIVFFIVLFSILFSLISVVRHNQYLSHAYDLGLFSQVIFNYSHHGIGDSSIRGFTNILGDHFSPILILFTPLYFIWSDPRILLIAQAIIVSLAIWPLYKISKPKISHFPAMIICLSYLLFCGLGFAVRFDFHEIILFPTLFLFALYFFEKSNYIYYFIFFILCLMVKENIAIYFIFFSIYFFIKNKSIGLITFFTSIIYYLAITKYIIPSYAEGNFAYFQFSQFGNNEIEALKNIIAQPQKIFFIATDNLQKIDSLLAIFGSYAYLIIFCPLFLFLCLPMLAEQFLYDAPTHWAIYYHYTIAIAPILALGSVCAIKRISNLGILKKSFNALNIAIFLVLLVLFSGIFINFLQKGPIVSFLTPSFYKHYSYVDDLDTIIKIIPKDASVGAQDSIVPHLSLRRYITPYPVVRDYRMLSPEYYIFTTEGSYYPLYTRCEEIVQIASFFANQDYGLYKRINDVYVFKKNYHDEFTQLDGFDYLANRDLTCIIKQ